MKQASYVVFKRPMGERFSTLALSKANGKDTPLKALTLAAAVMLTGQAGAAELNIAEQQPLLIGSTNRIIADGQNRVIDTMRSHDSHAKYHLWAQGVSAESNLAHDGLRMGYQNTDKGIVIGSDKHLTERFSAGMALSYIQSEADSLDHTVKHKMSAETTGVIAFADYQANDATRAHAYVGAGRANIAGERQFNTALSDASALSDYSASTYQAGVAVHHRIGTVDSHISPFVALDYQQVAANSYTETGVGVLNLSVADQTYMSVRSTVGVQGAKNIGAKFSVNGMLAAAFENGDSSTDSRAALAGVPKDSFYTQGREVGDTAMIAGAGLSYAMTPTASVTAAYQGEWRKDYDNQAAQLGVTMKF